MKKAAKHLRNCLAWRESIGTDNLMADEFSAELAEGVAYVCGHDDESRPVLIFRFSQDYQKCFSQKKYTRLVVFTLEVAIQTMAKNIDKFIVLFDASFFRSASAFMSIIIPTLKIMAEHYPLRLHKAFVIDPPSYFSYLWKGVRPFVELSSMTMVISSLDFEESMEFNAFREYPRAESLRFDSSSIPSSGKIGSCVSSRFAFTVNHHIDSLKPWYLSLTDTSSSKSQLHTARISPLNARSFSFDHFNNNLMKKNLFPSTPLPQKTHKFDHSNIIYQTRTPKPSFLQSPALFFKKESNLSKSEKSKESFIPFLKFYRRPYDEMSYRSKMRPPLGGLISIVSPHLRRTHMSVSQRF